MSSLIEAPVLPGDDVTGAVRALLAAATAHGSVGAAPILRLGGGLVQRGDSVLATKAGVLAHRAPNRFFVDSNHRRYVPAVGDTVVGVVVDKLTESYRVRLHGTTTAQLPALAFDGATKRNKPSLEPGAVVFARVAACSRHMEPELTCQAAGGAKRDWMTGESVFGRLAGGHVVSVSLGHARRLLDAQCAVLAAAGAAVPFEIAVGVNGMAWVQAASVRHTVAIAMAIERSEVLTDAQARLLVAQLLAALAEG